MYYDDGQYDEDFDIDTFLDNEHHIEEEIEDDEYMNIYYWWSEFFDDDSDNQYYHDDDAAAEEARVQQLSYELKRKGIPMNDPLSLLLCFDIEWGYNESKYIYNSFIQRAEGCVQEVATKLLIFCRQQHMVNELKKYKLPYRASYQLRKGDLLINCNGFYDERCNMFVENHADWPWRNVAPLIKTLLEERQLRIEQLDNALEFMTSQLLPSNHIIPHRNASSSSSLRTEASIPSFQCSRFYAAAAAAADDDDDDEHSTFLPEHDEKNGVVYPIPQSIIQCFSIITPQKDHYFKKQSIFIELCNQWVNYGEGDVDMISQLPYDRFKRNQILEPILQKLNIKEDEEDCYHEIQNFIDSKSLNHSSFQKTSFYSYFNDDEQDDEEWVASKNKRQKNGYFSFVEKSNTSKDMNKFISAIFKWKRKHILESEMKRKDIDLEVVKYSDQCKEFIKTGQGRGRGGGRYLVNDEEETLKDMIQRANQLVSFLIIDQEEREKKLFDALKYAQLEPEMQQAILYVMNDDKEEDNCYLHSMINDYLKKGKNSNLHELVKLIERKSRGKMFNDAALKYNLLGCLEKRHLCGTAADERRVEFISSDDEHWSQYHVENIVKTLIQEYEDRKQIITHVFTIAKLDRPICFGAKEYDEYINEAKHSPEQVLRLVQMSILMQVMEPGFEKFFQNYQENTFGCGSDDVIDEYVGYASRHDDNDDNDERLFNDDGMILDAVFYNNMKDYVNEHLLTEHHQHGEIFFELKQQLYNEREEREKIVEQYLISKRIQFRYSSFRSHGLENLPKDLRIRLSWYLSIGQDNYEKSILLDLAIYFRFQILSKNFPIYDGFNQIKIENYLWCKKHKNYNVLKKYSSSFALQQLLKSTNIIKEDNRNQVIAIDSAVQDILKGREYHGEPRCCSFILHGIDNYCLSFSDIPPFADMETVARLLGKQLQLEKNERQSMMLKAINPTLLNKVQECRTNDRFNLINKAMDEWRDFGIGSVEDIVTLFGKVDQEESRRTIEGGPEETVKGQDFVPMVHLDDDEGGQSDNKQRRTDKLLNALSKSKLSRKSIEHQQCVNFIENGTKVDDDDDEAVARLVEMLQEGKKARLKSLHEALESIGVHDVESKEENRNVFDDSFANNTYIVKMRSDFIETCPVVINEDETCLFLLPKPKTVMEVAEAIAQYHREVAIISELMQRSDIPKKWSLEWCDGKGAYRAWAKNNKKCIEFAEKGSYKGNVTVKQFIDSLVAAELSRDRL